ncbi:cell division protein FtsL [bacterium BMS3Abin09]|nr:cell division protein FtsL [bacterium BMS3Abin09]GBE40816.1 cell division protein FtsL [bacterium BMS3Bbin09]
MSNIRVKNRKKRGALIKVSFVIYFAFCLFAIVWLRASVVNIEYELGDLESQRADLYHNRKIVVAQRASYYSSEKIENVAIKRLGMSLPERENVFFVKRTAAAVAYKVSNNNSSGNRLR